MYPTPQTPNYIHHLLTSSFHTDTTITYTPAAASAPVVLHLHALLLHQSPFLSALLHTQTTTTTTTITQTQKIEIEYVPQITSYTIQTLVEYLYGIPIPATRKRELDAERRGEGRERGGGGGGVERERDEKYGIVATAIKLQIWDVANEGAKMCCSEMREEEIGKVVHV